MPHRAVARWAERFSGPVTLEELPGGHHFPFREAREALLARLAGILRATVGRGSG